MWCDLILIFVIPNCFILKIQLMITCLYSSSCISWIRTILINLLIKRHLIQKWYKITKISKINYGVGKQYVYHHGPGLANMLCIRFGALYTICQVWQICTINAKPVFHIRYVPGLAGLVQDWQVWQICVPLIGSW